jgi:hypothetical protein
MVHYKFFALKIEIQYNCSTFFIFYSRGNLESGSFTYLRNSVCKYIRNSGNFYCKKYRGIRRNSVCFSKNSVFRRKSKTHFRGHPKHNTYLNSISKKAETKRCRPKSRWAFPTHCLKKKKIILFYEIASIGQRSVKATVSRDCSTGNVGTVLYLGGCSVVSVSVPHVAIV